MATTSRTPGTRPGTFGTYTDGTYSTVNARHRAQRVSCRPYDALIGPDDTARSKLFQRQIKTTLDLGGDSSMVNRAYFGDGPRTSSRRTATTSTCPVQQSAQDRLEFHDIFSRAGSRNSLITGLDLRYRR